MTDEITTKPFASQAQQRMAFARKMPWAKRWARETDFSNLPKRVRKKMKRVKQKTCMDCVLASLKGEQIAPGVTRIRGNLCNVHGRYGPCDASQSGKKPKGGKGRKPRAPRAGAKPKQTPEQRQAARAQQRRDQRDQVLHDMGIDPGASEALVMLRNGEQPQPEALARMGAETAGLVEQAADGSYRMTPSGRALISAAEAGDTGRAGDVISAARDRKTARTAREREAAQKKLDAAAKRAEAAAAAKKRAEDAADKRASGGSKGGSASSSADREAERQQTRQQREAERQADRKKREEERQADRAQRQREHEEDRAQRQQERAQDRAAQQQAPRSPAIARSRTPIQMPTRRRRPNATRATTKAANPGDYLVVEDRDKPSTWHLQVKKNGKPDHRLMGAAWAALHGGYRGNKYAGPNKGEALTKLKRLYASEKMDVPSEKSFAVFKDTAGAWRWISRTTTAYEDRDKEVISTKALEDSASAPGPRGPLRWWHMGRPDPLSADQPWGPGVDLGWCDFAALSGRTLIESGTFKNETIARAVDAHADELELSPGFFHAAGEPDASGVFSHIRMFERSLVPKWAGRASNPYTGLVVEKTMDQKKIQALKELGASDEVISALLSDVQQTEKSAEQDGVRYKDARPVVDFFSRLLRGEQIATKEEEAEPPAPEPEPAPDPLAELMATVKALQAEVASLKAPPPMDEEDKAVEDIAPSMEEDVVEQEPIEEEGGLTLSSEDLSAIGQVIAATLEPLIGALGITQKLDGHLSELKTMMGGMVKQKDDAQAALVARLDQTDAKLSELAGDAPRQGYRASSAPDNTIQALVQTAALKDGSIPTDDNPFADLVQQLFPHQR